MEVVLVAQQRRRPSVDRPAEQRLSYFLAWSMHKRGRCSFVRSKEPGLSRAINRAGSNDKLWRYLVERPASVLTTARSFESSGTINDVRADRASFAGARQPSIDAHY